MYVSVIPNVGVIALSKMLEDTGRQRRGKGAVAVFIIELFKIQIFLMQKSIV